MEFLFGELRIIFLTIAIKNPSIFRVKLAETGGWYRFSFNHGRASSIITIVAQFLLNNKVPSLIGLFSKISKTLNKFRFTGY